MNRYLDICWPTSTIVFLTVYFSTFYAVVQADEKLEPMCFKGSLNASSTSQPVCYIDDKHRLSNGGYNVFEIIKTIGQNANGAELSIRVIKLTDKTWQLRQGYTEETIKLLSTAGYNLAELWDHFVEYMDWSPSEFIGGYLAQVHGIVGSVFIHGSSLIVFIHRGGAWFVDLHEIVDEYGRGPFHTSLNVFAFLVTTYNVISTITDELSRIIAED